MIGDLGDAMWQVTMITAAALFGLIVVKTLVAILPTPEVVRNLVAMA